jgi:catechol 2,3-dioxygenase
MNGSSWSSSSARGSGLPQAAGWDSITSRSWYLITWSYPGALFLGAGGYHHHLGTNTWAGPNAHPSSADEARLLEWTIELPDRESLLGVGANLAAAGHLVDYRSAGEIVTRDQ